MKALGMLLAIMLVTCSVIIICMSVPYLLSLSNLSQDVRIFISVAWLVFLMAALATALIYGGRD